MAVTPRALPTVLTVALLVPAVVALADGAGALLPGELCATTVVDRHLGGGTTCFDARFDRTGLERLVELYRR